MKRLTHEQKIRRWFKTRKYLTDYTCDRVVGVRNLRSRVSEMKDVIFDKMINIQCNGYTARVAQYRSIA